MAIKINNDTVIDNSKNVDAGIGTFTQLNVKPIPTSFSPVDGATGQEVATNITINFDQQIYEGTGNITLREGSASGTILETIPVSSTNISGTTLSINQSNIFFNKNIYVVVDAGAVINSFGNGNNIIDTYNFSTVTQTVTTFSPSNGATNISLEENIVLTFTTAPTRGTGTINLRRDSATGTILQSYNAATDNKISINASNKTWTLNPSVSFPDSTDIYLEIPDGAIIGYTGLNVSGGDTHSFTANLNAGDYYGGGYVLRKSGGIAIIVAPCNAEVGTNWPGRCTALHYACNCTGVTSGWFIPSCTLLRNPGYCCRQNWDCYRAGFYWSDNAAPTGPQSWCEARAWSVRVCNGSSCSAPRSTAFCVRAFRCVSY